MTYSRFLAGAALAFVASGPAHSIDLELRTAAAPGGGDDTTAEPGETFTLTIDTRDGGVVLTCELTQEIAGSGIAPRFNELVSTPAPASRRFRIDTPGTYGWHLNHCADDTGSPVTASEYVRVVVPSDATPVDGVCGPADGQIVADFPSEADACGAGTMVIVNDDPAGGVYNWSCVGTDGGTDAYCMAVVATPPAPDEGASFSAERTGVLWNKTDILHWDFPAADGCVARGDWSGSLAPAGSSQYALPLFAGSRTYTLDCTNAAGTVSWSRTLP